MNQELTEADETAEFERRYTGADELRLSDSDSPGLIGYAAVFDAWSEEIWGLFKERIAPGAFEATIQNGDVRALINHDPNLIIGRTKNGTLRLSEDDHGLLYDVDLPDTTYAADLRTSIERKDITQNSFGFQTVRDEWSDDGKKRTLIEVKLFDVSPVTFPAYRQTKVKLRLRKIGIDYDALGVAILRSSRGLALDEDVEQIRSTIKTLSEYVSDSTSAPSAEETEDPGHPETESAPGLAPTLVRVRIAETQLRQNLTRRVSK